MEEENVICIKHGIPDTHSFIYKGKQYPFKYDFFKDTSKYFLDNPNLIEQNKTIQLVSEELEEILDFSDEAIQSFINFVQCQNIVLNKFNVVALYYLSKEYGVSELKCLSFVVDIFKPSILKEKARLIS